MQLLAAITLYILAVARIPALIRSKRETVFIAGFLFGTSALFTGLLRVRAVIARMRPLPDNPAFTPGESGSAVYPNGYQLEDLGPC
jgi:hypothetical protein